MANAIYDKFRQSRMTADTNIDLENEDVRIILCDTGAYTFSQTHDMLDDVAAGSRIAVSGALTGKTVVDGIFDHADVTFASVAGASCEALIYYRHTGVESTSRLIAFIDTGITGLPVTPNGGNINLVVHATGAFKS